VRRLEDVDVIGVKVVAGDNQWLKAVSQLLLTENCEQFGLESDRVVLGGGELAQAAQPLGALPVRENAFALLAVKFEDFRRGETKSESRCDDRTGRGSGNEVEVVEDGDPEVFLSPVSFFASCMAIDPTPPAPPIIRIAP